MSGNADAALERLKADEALDVSSQLQAARLAYFQALDTNEGLDRAKFTCLTNYTVFIFVITGNNGNFLQTHGV